MIPLFVILLFQDTAVLQIHPDKKEKKQWGFIIMRITHMQTHDESIRYDLNSLEATKTEKNICLGINIIASLTGLVVGIWALLCLISGLLHSGGFSNLSAELMAAAFGL